MLKIGLISAHDPFDRNNFSGTVYYIRRALARLPGVEVEVIGESFHRAKSLSSRAYRSLNHGRFASLNWVRDKLFKNFVAEIERDLDRLADDLDIIVAPVASEILASLERPERLAPIIFITDATPQYIRENYPLPVEDIAFAQERRVFEISSKIIYSSEFMVNRAREEFADIFQHHGDKIDVVPFGLNMDMVPLQSEHAAPCPGSQVELLFVGKNWSRKGGPIAVEAVDDLVARGFKARLTVVGCKPNGETSDNVEVIPYVNKNIPAQRDKYLKLLNRSHFLLLPTRADCTPMVIAEANAFNIPAIAADVGGISSLVDHGVSGYLVPVECAGAAYADIVDEALQEPSLYPQLAVAARKMYENRLNWDAWSEQIGDLANEVRGVA